ARSWYGGHRSCHWARGGSAASASSNGPMAWCLSARLLARHADEELRGQLVDEFRRVPAFLQLELELGAELRLAVQAEALLALEGRGAVADVVDRAREAHRRFSRGIRRRAPGKLLRQFNGKIRYVALGHV